MMTGPGKTVCFKKDIGVRESYIYTFRYLTSSSDTNHVIQVSLWSPETQRQPAKQLTHWQDFPWRYKLLHYTFLVEKEI
jgi:hypothetical protein